MAKQIAQRFVRQQRASLTAGGQQLLSVSAPLFDTHSHNTCRRHLLSHAIVPEHAKLALQLNESFNRQVMEELMHEILPRGGHFRVR